MTTVVWDREAVVWVCLAGLAFLAVTVLLWSILRVSDQADDAAVEIFVVPRPYECEVCGVKLTEVDARHLWAVCVDDLDEAQGWGGTGMTATFCTEHYPSD